jgi:hypothetical protein
VNDVPLEAVGTPEPLWRTAFLEPLVATPLDNGVDWLVDVAFSFESAVLGRIIVVPAGFITDFASIPKALWGIVGGPTGTYTKPACLHDFLYRTPGVCTRLQADQVLREAMEVTHVPKVTRMEIFEGVRIGGSSSYRGGL